MEQYAVSPLLEKLDWVFTSEHWTSVFPKTSVRTSAKTTSDHAPCCISIGTSIPKSSIFRFENFWLKHQDFKQVVANNWNQPIHESDSAKIITAKFKRLRKGLKIWARSLSNLATTIQATNEVIHMWDYLEEFRPLNVVENNGREILKEHLANILEMQQIYWKQRSVIRWAKLDDESAAFYKTKTIIQHKHNSIASLSDDLGNIYSEHAEKAHILWQAFKARLGCSKPTSNLMNFTIIIRKKDNL